MLIRFWVFEEYVKNGRQKRSYIMLRAAITFFVIGLIAMIFGAYGIAGLSVEVGKVLLMVFVVLAVLSFVVGLIRGGGNKRIP